MAGTSNPIGRRLHLGSRIHLREGTGVPPVIIITEPLSKNFLAEQSGKLSSRQMNVGGKASNCDRRTVVSGYFSSLITTHSALFTSFSPLFPALQSASLASPRLRRSRRLLPAGRSSPAAVQEPPAKSKFLAVR